MSHDDLPRSPTGRVPRWVVDDPAAPQQDASAPERPHVTRPGAPHTPSWASQTPASGASPAATSWAPQGPPPGTPQASTSWGRPTPPPGATQPPTPWGSQTPPSSPYGTAPAAAPGAPAAPPPPVSPADEWRPSTADPPAPPRDRRRLVTRLAVVAGVAGVGVWVATSVLPGLLQEADATFLDGVVVGRVPTPEPEVAQLATEMHLTDKGRDLLYMSEPELLGVEEFAGRCDRGGAAAEGGTAVGCYHSASGIRAGGRIVIYTPDDERLRGFVISTAAHELLHAAWTDLTADERATAAPLLESALRQVPADDDLHAQLAGSVAGNDEARATELFAYLGTQVYPAGGLDPALEMLYARYITDREALVAVHAQFEQTIDGLTSEVTTAQQTVAQRKYEHARGVAQLDADTATLAQYRATIEQEEARLASLSSSERARQLLAWTWRDGTPLPEAPAAQLLADARRLLARDEADFAARRAALDATAAEIAAEEQRVAAQRAELEELLKQLNPGA